MASLTSGDRRHHPARHRRRGNRPCWRSRVSCWTWPHSRSSCGRCRRTRRYCCLWSRRRRSRCGCQRDLLRHRRLHDCRLLPRRDRLRRDPSFRLMRLLHDRSFRRSSRLPVRGLPAVARWPDARPAMLHECYRQICRQFFCSSKACRRGATRCATTCRYRPLPRGHRHRRGRRHRRDQVAATDGCRCHGCRYLCCCHPSCD